MLLQSFKIILHIFNFAIKLQKICIFMKKLRLYVQSFAVQVQYHSWFENFLIRSGQMVVTTYMIFKLGWGIAGICQITQGLGQNIGKILSSCTMQRYFVVVWIHSNMPLSIEVRSTIYIVIYIYWHRTVHTLSLLQAMRAFNTRNKLNTLTYKCCLRVGIGLEILVALHQSSFCHYCKSILLMMALF